MSFAKLKNSKNPKSELTLEVSGWGGFRSLGFVVVGKSFQNSPKQN